MFSQDQNLILTSLGLLSPPPSDCSAVKKILKSFKTFFSFKDNIELCILWHNFVLSNWKVWNKCWGNWRLKFNSVWKPTKGESWVPSLSLPSWQEWREFLKGISLQTQISFEKLWNCAMADSITFLTNLSWDRFTLSTDGWVSAWVQKMQILFTADAMPN